MPPSSVKFALSPLEEQRYGVRTVRVPELASAGIPGLMAFCREQGVHFVVARCTTTDLATAQDFEEVGGRLMDTLVYYVRDVARALHFAHEQGIVHRDVKPQNVILDESGKPYVMDFGLARDEAMGSLTQSGDVFGTPLYMSPEQVSGRRSEIGPRTDVYSLGCTLYELLTLRPAFDADTSEEILRKILLAEPKRPRQINRRLPPDLENVTLRAMHKSADKRYATAAEFADDLDRFLKFKAAKAMGDAAQGHGGGLDGGAAAGVGVGVGAGLGAAASNTVSAYSDAVEVLIGP